MCDASLDKFFVGCSHVRSVRDEDSAVYRSCAFLGNFAALALGTHSGEIRIHDTLSGDLIDTIDAHDTPAYQLRVGFPVACASYQVCFSDLPVTARLVCCCIPSCHDLVIKHAYTHMESCMRVHKPSHSVLLCSQCIVPKGNKFSVHTNLSYECILYMCCFLCRFHGCLAISPHRFLGPEDAVTCAILCAAGV